MKKHSCISRVLSILLVALIATVLPLSVSAQEVILPDDMEFPSVEEKSVLEGSSIQPQGFTKTYTKYLTSSSTYIMGDSNWFGEDVVLVEFTSSEGPTQISVYVIDGAGNTIGPKSISLSRSAGFMLKSVSGTFEVYAKKTAGYDGNVTVKVQLTNTY